MLTEGRLPSWKSRTICFQSASFLFVAGVILGWPLDRSSGKKVYERRIKAADRLIPRTATDAVTMQVVKFDRFAIGPNEQATKVFDEHFKKETARCPVDGASIEAQKILTARFRLPARLP
jgi:hypothetical protein